MTDPLPLEPLVHAPAMPAAATLPSPVARVLLTPSLPGAENMALDEALLARARRTGETVLRVYTWSRPTLSLGRNQLARGAFDAERARAAGVDLVRRLTGGRALLHHREVTYSVTARLGPDASLRAWYAGINAILLRALRSLGIAATLAPRGGQMPPPASAPCFELPAEGEIMVAGRKLVGSALVRDNGALLQHGSILIADDQGLVASLSSVPTAEVMPAATLGDALGRAPDVREVADALFDAARLPAASPLPALVLDDATRDLAVQTARARYASDDWTWRR